MQITLHLEATCAFQTCRIYHPGARVSHNFISIKKSELYPFQRASQKRVVFTSTPPSNGLKQRLAQEIVHHYQPATRKECGLIEAE